MRRATAPLIPEAGPRRHARLGDLVSMLAGCLTSSRGTHRDFRVLPALRQRSDWAFRYCRNCQFDFDGEVPAADRDPTTVVPTGATVASADPALAAKPRFRDRIGRRGWIAAGVIAILVLAGLTGGNRETPTSSASAPPSDIAAVASAPSPTRAASAVPTVTLAPTTPSPIATPTPFRPHRLLPPRRLRRRRRRPRPRRPRRRHGSSSRTAPGRWGLDVQPGTYRTREPVEFCYWERVKNFNGDLESIIANDNASGYAVVTIAKSDVGFNTSGCGTWSSDLSRVTDTTQAFGEGTYIVGTDIEPGTYRELGGEFCYWSRLSGFGGGIDQIIANANVSGPTIGARATRAS